MEGLCVLSVNLQRVVLLFSLCDLLLLLRWFFVLFYWLCTVWLTGFICQRLNHSVITHSTQWYHNIYTSAHTQVTSPNTCQSEVVVVVRCPLTHTHTNKHSCSRNLSGNSPLSSPRVMALYTQQAVTPTNFILMMSLVNTLTNTHTTSSFCTVCITFAGYGVS